MVAPVNDGQWHHVAYTLSVDGQANIYVDGAPVASATDLDLAGLVLLDAIDIGRRSVGTSSALYFTGRLDNVLLEHRELSEAEIMALGM